MLNLRTHRPLKSLFVCDADEAILLGFQHYLVMLGTTVLIPTALVPQMGGGNVRLEGENSLTSSLLSYIAGTPTLQF